MTIFDHSLGGGGGGPGSMALIDHVTASAGALAISLAAISQKYTHLKILGRIGSTSSSTSSSDGVALHFNGDLNDSNYKRVMTAQATQGDNIRVITSELIASTLGTGTPKTSFSIEIPNYTSPGPVTLTGLGMWYQGNQGTYAGPFATTWLGVGPITEIDFNILGNAFQADSEVWLYGF